MDDIGNASKDINERGASAHDVMVAAVENAEKNLETEEGFQGQKQQSEKISDFILSDRNVIKSMLASAGISLTNNHHSTTVSSLSLAIARKLRITD